MLLDRNRPGLEWKRFIDLVFDEGKLGFELGGENVEIFEEEKNLLRNFTEGGGILAFR